MTGVFADRRDAGRALADLLAGRDWRDPVVFGIARGGVPVAAEVADRLGAPLGVAVARKIATARRPEFGLGAVTAYGPPYFDPVTLRMAGLRPEDLAEEREAGRREARRRLQRYRVDEQPDAAGRDVILVDDGLATGVTATAVVLGLRDSGPRSVVFAAPVCARSAQDALRELADDVVCVHAPTDFRAVSAWYRRFPQLSDDEVLAALG